MASKLAPIPVRLIAFVDERQPVPGASMKSQTGNKNHEILYYPWLRAFRVIHKETGAESFIPEARVLEWRMVDPPEPPSTDE